MVNTNRILIKIGITFRINLHTYLLPKKFISKLAILNFDKSKFNTISQFIFSIKIKNKLHLYECKRLLIIFKKITYIFILKYLFEQKLFHLLGLHSVTPCEEVLHQCYLLKYIL